MSRRRSVSETQSTDEALAIKGFRALMHVWLVDNYKTVVLSRFCGTSGDFTLVNIYSNEVFDGPLVAWVKDHTFHIIKTYRNFDSETLYAADPAFFDKIKSGFERLGVH